MGYRNTKNTKRRRRAIHRQIHLLAYMVEFYGPLAGRGTLVQNRYLGYLGVLKQMDPRPSTVTKVLAKAKTSHYTWLEDT